jgi:hypothetical protein
MGKKLFFVRVIEIRNRERAIAIRMRFFVRIPTPNPMEETVVNRRETESI